MVDADESTELWRFPLVVTKGVLNALKSKQAFRKRFEIRHLQVVKSAYPDIGSKT